MIFERLRVRWKRLRGRNLPFWLARAPEALTHAEWESLCDGCGRCCLHKLDRRFWPFSVQHTNIACRMLASR